VTHFNSLTLKNFFLLFSPFASFSFIIHPSPHISLPLKHSSSFSLIHPSSLFDNKLLLNQPQAPSSQLDFSLHQAYISPHQPQQPTPMESDWSLDFCLACDKQTTEGAYCSQACRAADLHMAEAHRLHTGQSTAPSSPPTTLSSWTFPQGRLPASPSLNPTNPTHNVRSSHQSHRDESSTISKRTSAMSLDGLFHEGPATGMHSSSSSTNSSSSTASSPTTTGQHFLAEHVRQALKVYENLFDQNRRRKHSSAS